MWINEEHRKVSRGGLPTGLLTVLTMAACLTGCSSDRIDFNREIRPILNRECVQCHGGVRQRAGLSLLFRSDAMDPADSGREAVVPGDPGASELIRRIRHDNAKVRMPKRGDPLSQSDIEKLTRWIEQGADWEDHWAYVAPERPAEPDISDPSWPNNGIDEFVLARLDQSGLRPSAPADCAVLVRRVTLDLTGLPPSAEKVDELCEDPAIDGFERYVDSLLSSPSFGERWASFWLDLARYADSQGYEADHYRSIWQYRDWVIRALNSGMPFDDFTIEQLAGDLLQNPTRSQLIATAFHRNTMTNTEGGTDDEEHRIAAVIDRLNTTWEVWQGTSFGCAQCHGHPYDPIRQTDYYRAFAFFNNTSDWDQTDDRPTLQTFSAKDRERGEALLRRMAVLDNTLARRSRLPRAVEAREEWASRLDEPETVGAIANTRQNKLLRIVSLTEAERDDRQRDVLAYIFSQIDLTLKDIRDERENLVEELGELEPITTPIMQELPAGGRRRTRVLDRGNFLVPTIEVEPGTPEFLPGFPEGEPGNRLGLARWLVAPENPLTARVVTNRIWEQIFGNGLVETLEDFGTQGVPPTHQELLDWLAVEFRSDWSVKRLLKLIVTSATYQQSSSLTPDLIEHDPRNLLLARGPRVRLSAEQIRDQALAVSGLLSSKMFGPSVMPPQPPGIWQNPYSEAKWETSEGEDRYRRAVYTYWRRTAPHPAMTAFDSPSREFCVSRRIRTNTPLQALVTLNDPALVEAARALAERMGGTFHDDRWIVEEAREALITGYRTALGRAPTPAKLDTLLTFFEESLEAYSSDLKAARAFSGTRDRPAVRAALTASANVILNLDEFITKE